MEWTYGILRCNTESPTSKLLWERNPVFLDNIKISQNKAIQFNLNGHGKIIQVSFTSDSKDATLAFSVDGGNINKVNNGYCLMNLCDTRGIGYFQIQEIEKDKKWRYTCLIPVIFNKEIFVTIGNEGHKNKDIKVSDVHIYYLVPWKKDGTD